MDSHSLDVETACQKARSTGSTDDGFSAAGVGAGIVGAGAGGVITTAGTGTTAASALAK